MAIPPTIKSARVHSLRGFPCRFLMIKNQIINYFLAISTADNTVIKTIQSPITISAVVAKKLILEQYQIDKQFKILHACYDVDSKIIYLPNASDFARDTLNDFFKVIKFQIVKDFKESYSFRPAIEGSPFSSLRYRTIESFQQATNTIKNEFKDFTNLPVIEANLNRMPTTKKTLPDKYKSNSEFIGG